MHIETSGNTHQTIIWTSINFILNLCTSPQSMLLVLTIKLIKSTNVTGVTIPNNIGEWWRRRLLFRTSMLARHPCIRTLSTECWHRNNSINLITTWFITTVPEILKIKYVLAIFMFKEKKNTFLQGCSRF